MRYRFGIAEREVVSIVCVETGRTIYSAQGTPAQWVEVDLADDEAAYAHAIQVSLKLARGQPPE